MLFTIPKKILNRSNKKKIYLSPISKIFHDHPNIRKSKGLSEFATKQATRGPFYPINRKIRLHNSPHNFSSLPLMKLQND